MTEDYLAIDFHGQKGEGISCEIQTVSKRDVSSSLIGSYFFYSYFILLNDSDYYFNSQRQFFLVNREKKQ